MGEQSEAVRIKNEGNTLFAKGDYAGAESCYSRAYASNLSTGGKKEFLAGIF
jgi:hypothetical protein